MSQQAQQAALVALLRSGTRSSARWAEAVEEQGDALVLLEREQRRSGPGQISLFDEADQGRALPDLVAQADADLRRWRAEGLKILTVLDSEYPVNLRLAHDRPALIFAAGELREQDVRSVAVIGTRTATSAGLTSGGVISAGLAALEYTVFSGLAAGIDTAAHEAVLARGARTVAVVGTGLRHAYPPGNAALQRRIAAAGAVVSSFWPETPPARWTFPVRNALMSALTLGTVIVEAGERSGAQLQARAGLAQGRPLFLLEGLLERGWARALAGLPGVHVIHSAQQVDAVLERLATDCLTT